MRITLSIPDPVAKRSQSAIPPRQRSRLVTQLIVDEEMEDISRAVFTILQL